MRKGLALALVAACSSSKAPESSSSSTVSTRANDGVADRRGEANGVTTTGSSDKSAVPVVTGPPQDPPKSGGSADGTRVQQAKQQGVLGSTTISSKGAFAPLGGGGSAASGFDDTRKDKQKTLGIGKSSESGGAGLGGLGGGQGALGVRLGSVTAKLGTPTIVGKGIEKQVVDRIVKANVNRLRYCYEKELVATPDIKGVLQLKYTIGVDGKVTVAEAKGVHANVEACVTNVAKGLAFPKPSDGKELAVEYKVTFARSAK